MTEEERDDLRATAEDLIADAQQLAAIEESKLRADPESPAVLDLAQAAEKVARRIADKARVETELAEQLTPSG